MKYNGHRSQGSLEYLFMIAVALVIVLIVFRVATGLSTPHTIMLNVDPQGMTHPVDDSGKFKVEAWLEDNGDGTYKVEYRIWALKERLNGAKVELVCFGDPQHVAGLGLIEHEGVLEPVNYWANYWTPVPREAFPCQVQFIVWTEGLG